jgi:hypothetical protein
VSKTPAQVRSDLSINGIGSETAPTITNLNTLTVAGEYFSVQGATGAPDGNVYLVKHYAADSASAAFQEAFRFADGARFWRREVAGVWQSWTVVQPALGFTPVEQGGGAGVGTNKVRIGWGTGGGLRLQVDVSDLGQIALHSEFGQLTAAQGTGAVGTYALLRNDAVATNINPGDTIAGSSLAYATASGDSPNARPTGTWRCMGFAGPNSNAALTARTTVYLRIA